MTIRLTGASLRHGQVQALHGIDLQIGAGERVAIIGPSGAGKSSLLQLLGTALAPSTGAVELLDVAPWRLSAGARQRLRARIGLIHQAPPLPPRQRVVTAVLAGRLGQWSTLRGLLNLLHPADVPGVREVLTSLGMAEKIFVQCGQLSGGQLQRVGIARALYQQPQILLADEPVSAMDPVLAEHSLKTLNQHANERGVTLIASLHAVELALAHFPRVIGVREGRIVFDRPASEVSSDMLDGLYANEHLVSPPLPLPALNLQIPRC
ncbi:MULTISPECIES: ATP-binding cassette domain-containing protein [Pseudomonas]|uniref:ATP-binding cassette domain-containing protein n=1 Tax=Pseudomonas donghuensis TaxID=1163398 RepID=A0AAP0XCF7_9PSED|nr:MULTISPECIES: ATP-binding cassette domain-containing protein [Pseudomonas]KDO02087.1 ATP-binding cassette domain-containing protein [Pseudomonas donghuensis]MBF4209120.1 ATP-binding cassette domain-containing protein [Pseudomonas donghuensis]MBS7599467.1 ATP-binding cassette domain-containing protein [Pseudomonas sp. RC2C2]MCP6693398.1 ATP-binding cassette domain-containing protein [Pseudomonas donghuensis]MCP6695111.1 ATP-binding cassette domain-containing protein [Pseudomonas donghuensis]